MPVETTMELVEIADYMNKPELLEHFKCQHIKENKQAHPRYWTMGGAISVRGVGHEGISKLR